MAMVCPQCNDSFAKRSHCPNCGVRLHYQHDTAGSGQPGNNHGWQHTPLGRILVGLVIAQGVYHGLRHLLAAGLLAVGDESAQEVWTTLTGLIVVQVLQALGLLIGGAIVGAGDKQGTLYGGMMGVWNGVLSILLQRDHAHLLTAITLYGQPLLQTAFGAIGGFLGSRIWQPLPALILPGNQALANQAIAKPRKPSPFAGPIAWGRVAVGATLAVGGTLWANVVLDMLLDASEGKLNVDTHLQAQIVTWEITGVAMLVGSALAGVNTMNGLKQGLCVGLTSAALLIGFRVGASNTNLQNLLITAACAVVLGLAGGWFGGQLFPPVFRAPRRNKYYSTAG